MCGIERYERTWGAEWDGEGEETAKALVSITWVPWVLMTLMLELRGRWVAVPWRAGMVWMVRVVGVAMIVKRLSGRGEMISVLYEWG